MYIMLSPAPVDLSNVLLHIKKARDIDEWNKRPSERMIVTLELIIGSLYLILI